MKTVYLAGGRSRGPASSHPLRSVLPWLALGAALLAPTGLRAQVRGVGAGNNPATTPPADATDAPTSSAADAAPAAAGEPDRVVVVGTLDEKRNNIVSSLGATTYGITQNQLNSQSQGVNAPFNQTLLRVPGFAQDSYGQLHVRGEHANLQYRINDVLLPEGITGFGQELDTRFVDNLQVVTGSLPAQYGFRTAGIIDIHTKSGAFDRVNELSLYGGSFNTVRPALELAGTAGRLDYFVTGSYFHSGIGIENPTGSVYPIHDHTEQYRGFGYLSSVIDKTSRLSLIVSGYDANFQIPNNPGQPPAFALTGVPTLPGSVTGFGGAGAPGLPAGVAPQPLGVGARASAHLNENQNEQNYYAVLAYQKSAGALDFQQSVFIRDSSLLFRPDNVGDLVFNGVASREDRSILTGGAELDASFRLTDAHTLRGGYLLLVQHASAKSATKVFATDDTGAQASADPQLLILNQRKTGEIFGVYLQDEWKITPQLTLNFGARYDRVAEYVHEGQLSPRVNLVWQPTERTALHLGYARYFTPPPLESVQSTGLRQTLNTTNAPQVTQNSPITSERAHYFDAGVTQNLFGGLQLGLDGYFKQATQQLDEGQFGAAIIESPFNYRYGEVYGLEGTLTYVRGGFEAYANAAYSSAHGKKINSSQFLFGPDELAYIRNHLISLDHDQTSTVSAGVSYFWKEQDLHVSVDMLYGSGLRRGFANTAKLPAYYTFNLGFEKGFRVARFGQVKVRFDVVNLNDQSYELRDGSGVGVGAPQFGQRRGFYGGLAVDFGPQPGPAAAPGGRNRPAAK